MLISLNYIILPVVLTLIHSVTCVDLYKSKRVPRDLKTRTPYNVNHPPLQDTYIPVSVIYDDEEDVGIRNKNVKEATNFSEDSKINLRSRGTVSNERKAPQRRRLQRVIKKKIIKNQTSTHEKTEKAPAPVALPQSEGNSKNNSQSSINSKFQKRTQERNPFVRIVDSENYVYADRGDFHYSYESGDGTKAFERSESKPSDGGSSPTGVVGGFSYTDKDGNDFSLSYTADENGYRPVGAHLPTSPPIPPAIQRALDILATKTTPEPITERVHKLN